MEAFITYDDDDSKATRRNKTANTTKQFQICSDSVVSRNSPGAEGRAELSFVWAACGATCALRCGICIGVLTEAEVGLATSEPQFEDASACVLAGRCPLMPGRGGGEWTKQM